MQAQSPLATQRSYSTNKSSLVDVAVSSSCGWMHVLPQTILAQDGAALEERWSAGNVEVSCCWVPTSLVAQLATPEFREVGRLGQVSFNMVPASLPIPPLTPGQREAGGPGEWCWMVAEPDEQPAGTAPSTREEW
jgi:hypothetical protein